MQKLIQAVLDLKQFKFRLDDDFADRLNRQYTAALHILMAVLVSARQYFGEAIHCWCPEVCASNHETYANIFCWVDDTYYVPFYEKMPQDDEGRERKITYYQWVPIILMLECLMFLFPYAVWRMLNARSGINIGVIIEAALSSQYEVCPEQRDKTLRYAVHLMDRYLLAQRDHRTGCLSRIKQMLSKHCIFVYGKLYGNYLTSCYLFVKVLYSVNAVGQLFLLDVFLGYDFHFLGIHVVRHLLFGDEWRPSDRFPRVSMCDYRIRQNTNVHRYTVQCVLPINLFNEKIFTVLWFWLFILAVLTLIALVHWLCRLIYWPVNYRFVKRKLNFFEDVHQDSSSLKRFADNYLRRDGLFILRLVAKNAGDLVATEILTALWDNFTPKHRLLGEIPKKSKFSKSRAAKDLEKHSEPTTFTSHKK